MRRLSVTQPALLLLPVAIASLILAQFGIAISLADWANKSLLVIFFFVVGAELSHEYAKDRSAAHIVTPLLAAIGGMAVPALLYLAAAHQFGATPAAWGVPMATDLPIVLALYALFGKTSRQTRIFLLALAIFDDIGSILVIAFRFTSEVSINWLTIAILGVIIFAMVARTNFPNWIDNERRLRFTAPLLLSGIGLGVWHCTLQSGVHPTVAGAVLGALLPAKKSLSAIKFWEPVTNYFVLPLFVLTSFAIPLVFSWRTLFQPMVVALLIARLLGKPIGIALGIFLARKGLSIKDGLTTSDYFLVSVLGTVGFSVSMLFAELSLIGEARATALFGIIVTLPLAIFASILALKRSKSAIS